MTTPIALRSIVCLCALGLLASCGLLPPKPQAPITHTEFLTVPVPAYRRLPTTLTDPLVLPPRPLLDCSDGHGAPALCVTDALATIPSYQALVDTCNRDRAKSAALGETDAPY